MSVPRILMPDDDTEENSGDAMDSGVPTDDAMDSGVRRSSRLSGVKQEPGTKQARGNALVRDLTMQLEQSKKKAAKAAASLRTTSAELAAVKGEVADMESELIKLKNDLAGGSVCGGYDRDIVEHALMVLTSKVSERNQKIVILVGQIDDQTSKINSLITNQARLRKVKTAAEIDNDNAIVSAALDDLTMDGSEREQFEKFMAVFRSCALGSDSVEI